MIWGVCLIKENLTKGSTLKETDQSGNKTARGDMLEAYVMMPVEWHTYALLRHLLKLKMRFFPPAQQGEK